MPYFRPVQSVVETNAYLRAAKVAGISEEERDAIVDLIASNPEAGDIMPGCGGARKLRIARPGGGKSGGYRIVTYFANEDAPLFLLTAFPKNMKTNLTKSEQNQFATACKRLVASLTGDQ